MKQQEKTNILVLHKWIKFIVELCTWLLKQQVGPLTCASGQKITHVSLVFWLQLPLICYKSFDSLQGNFHIPHWIKTTWLLLFFTIGPKTFLNLHLKSVYFFNLTWYLNELLKSEKISCETTNFKCNYKNTLALVCRV